MRVKARARVDSPRMRVFWTAYGLAFALSACAPVSGEGSGGAGGGGYTGNGGEGGGGGSGEPCGNGTIDSGERCDGDDLRGFGCWDLGSPGGSLACSETCNFDVSACDPFPVCGDNIGEGIEACDGADLGGWDCQSAGYGEGTLACHLPGHSNACEFDASGCTGNGPDCGDNSIEGLEQCDGTDLGGIGCTDIGLGYTGGVLACDGDCTFDDSSCEGSPPECGDGAIGGAEECDGDELDGATCASIGFYAGVLGCDGTTCTYDISRCHWCGNREIDAGEECDRSDLGNMTCQDFGYDDGHLHCTWSSCQFDTQNCWDNDCLPEETGLTRCIGDILEVCDIGGVWIEEVDCLLDGRRCITIEPGSAICLDNL